MGNRRVNDMGNGRENDMEIYMEICRENDMEIYRENDKGNDMEKNCKALVLVLHMVDEYMVLHLRLEKFGEEFLLNMEIFHMMKFHISYGGKGNMEQLRKENQ